MLVTGMAWSTALGSKLDEVWGRLLAGDCGLRDVPSEHPVRNLFAGPVDWPPADRPARERQLDLAVGTAARALEDAGLTGGNDSGVSGSGGGGPLLVVGTSYGGHLDDPDGGGLHQWAVDTARRLGLSAPPVSLSTACSSGSDAIAIAAMLIASGAADTCLCGGVDILTPAKRLGHTALGTMSPTRLRAFDARADGTLLGEGAGFLVLERVTSARRRGATAYAALAGAGCANDAAGLTAPDPSGNSILLAVRRSLAAADLHPDDVAVVNAHGSGTPANDEVEGRSLTRLFTGRRPTVFATKGALGHSLGATGAIEAIALILALRDRQAPPVLGLATPRAGVGLPVARGAPGAVGTGVGVSVTLGFGGFNTSLVVDTSGRVDVTGRAEPDVEPVRDGEEIRDRQQVRGRHPVALAVVTRGSAQCARLDAGGQRAASVYADPVAWLVVDAVDAALADPDGPGRAVRAGGPGVGVVTVSEEATLHTMRLMSSGLRRGRVSPLRFAGANPGTVAGLPCIVNGFKGPSLVLSMPLAAGATVAEAVARSWLGSGACRYVVVNEHEAGGGGHTVHTRVLADSAAGRTAEAGQ